MTTIKNIFLICTLFLLSGCIPTYTLVTAGVNSVDTLQVTAGGGWNQAPNMPYAGDRKNTVKWTRDGLLLDRLVFVPEVSDGESLIISQQKDAALPVFKKDMLPNEIEELAQSTFVKLFGEGNAVVETSNLRPHRYGENRGVMFDVEAKVTESPDYKGLVGAFIANEKLYFMFYLAADPYYFEKHRVQAENIIKSATLTPAS